jgi:hypothetical protein
VLRRAAGLDAEALRRRRQEASAAFLTHAIDVLALVRADLPADRKLADLGCREVVENDAVGRGRLGGSRRHQGSGHE